MPISLESCGRTSAARDDIRSKSPGPDTLQAGNAHAYAGTAALRIIW
jgi:hypothetical protein